MIEMPGLIPALLRVSFADVRCTFLRDIDVNSHRVLNPDAGERNHISQIALDQDIRKGFCDSLEHRFDIFYVEAEMIEPGSDPRISPEQSEADGSVADVAHIGPALTGLISHSRSDLFHSKDGFVKGRHLFVTLCINRHVSNSREHEMRLSLPRMYYQIHRRDKLSSANATAMSEFHICF